MGKVFVIGVDGGTLELIERWKDDLPNFRRLMEGGVYGRMESTLPPVTCPAWNGLFTGKNPGKMGIFTHWALPIDKDKNAKLANYSLQDSPSIWDILGDSGKKVGIVNVPTTYPPKKVNGFMVSDWFEIAFYPGIDYTYPAEFRQKLEKLGYQVHPLVDLTIPRKEKVYIKRFGKLINQQVNTIKRLITEEPWDFFVYVFNPTDGAQHYMWHHLDETHPWHDKKRSPQFRDGIKTVYRMVDRAIGELAAAMPSDTTVFIVSDHGAQASHGLFFTNEWLRENGLLVLKGTEKKAGLVGGFISWSVRTTLRFFGPDMVDFLRKIARKLPAAIINRLFNAIMLEGEGDLIQRIDWSKTKAYSVGMAGGILINARDGDPHGIVPPEEYEALRDRIAGMLLDLKGPGGENLHTRVIKKENAYSGKYTSVAPDLMFSLDDYHFTQRANLSAGKIWSEPPTSGWHSMYGTFMACGPDIKNGVKLSDVSIYDFAPTVLHLLGLPVPSDADGRVLVEIFKPGSEPAQRKVNKQAAYASKTAVRGKIEELKNTRRL